MKVKWSYRASEDLKACLFWSADHFGAVAARRYQALIKAAVSRIAVDPMLPGSKDLPESERAIRLYHLRHCKKQVIVEGASVKKPKHLIAYFFDESGCLWILRLLHDSFDLQDPTLFEE